MNEDKKEKIVLSEKIQKEMMEFFLKTSIPRKKKMIEEQKKSARLLSESKSDRSDKDDS